jgi:hypothetical protein
MTPVMDVSERRWWITVDRAFAVDVFDIEEHARVAAEADNRDVVEVVPAADCRGAVDAAAFERLAALIYERDDAVRTMEVARAEARAYAEALLGPATRPGAVEEGHS